MSDDEMPLRTLEEVKLSDAERREAAMEAKGGDFNHVIPPTNDDTEDENVNENDGTEDENVDDTEDESSDDSNEDITEDDEIFLNTFLQVVMPKY